MKYKVLARKQSDRNSYTASQYRKLLWLLEYVWIKDIQSYEALKEILFELSFWHGKMMDDEWDRIYSELPYYD